MINKINKFLASYEAENGVRILDWQQVAPRLLDVCVQAGGFFSEPRWVKVNMNL